MQESAKIVFAGACMTLAVCAVFLYKSNNKESETPRTMHVEGKAEYEADADIADWIMCFEHTGEVRSELQREIDQEKHEVIAFLVHNGIPEKDIEFYNYIKEDYSRNRNKQEYIPRYRMGYSVRVKTEAVDLVTKLKNNLTEIFNKNLEIVKNNIRLTCSKQEEIELSLYKNAVQNAISKAKSVSESAGLKVDKIITIENPIFMTESPYQEHSFMKYMDTNSVSFAPDNNASQVMKRRKIKGTVNLTVSIK